MFPKLNLSGITTQQLMDVPNFIMVTTWINVRICVPFTFLLIAVCYMERPNHVPVTYYMNLFVLNLIQLITLIVVMVGSKQQRTSSLYLIYFYSYICVSMGSLCFRTVIALEGYFFISLPQLLCIRQTKGFGIICVPVWLFLIFVIPVFLVSHQYMFLIFFPLFSVLMFVFCLAETLKSLPAATSVPVKRKRIIVQTLVLLLVHYSMIALPTVIYFIYAHSYPPIMTEIVFVFSLLSFLLDLVHFVLICKGPIMCFWCCRIKNTAVKRTASDHRSDRCSEISTHSQQQSDTEETI